MASLMELIDRVNKGEMVDPAQLEIYQESSNKPPSNFSPTTRMPCSICAARNNT